MTNEELALAIKAGNQESTAQLWKQCYGFIKDQALKWSRAWSDRPSFDLDDLMQGGYMGLCAAVEAFEDGRGSFINILSYCLKTAFSEVVGCRTAAQKNEPINNAVSLDAPAYNDQDSEITVADTIACNDPGLDAVDDSMYKKHLSSLVNEAVDSLPGRQRSAILGYYIGGKTYKELGEAMNVETSYSGQLVKDGLKRLRTGKYAPSLAELLYGEENLYTGTGFGSWKNSGMSVQERSVIWHEQQEKHYTRSDDRQSRIAYCMEALGMDRATAERLFPV